MARDVWRWNWCDVSTLNVVHKKLYGIFASWSPNAGRRQWSRFIEHCLMCTCTGYGCIHIKSGESGETLATIRQKFRYWMWVVYDFYTRLTAMDRLYWCTHTLHIVYSIRCCWCHFYAVESSAHQITSTKWSMCKKIIPWRWRSDGQCLVVEWNTRNEYTIRNSILWCSRCVCVCVSDLHHHHHHREFAEGWHGANLCVWKAKLFKHGFVRHVRCSHQCYLHIRLAIVV